MGKFKNNVSDGWLFKQELRLFRNFVRNWTKDVDDCDFFDIFDNSNNTTREAAANFLKKFFEFKELASIGNGIDLEYETYWVDQEGNRLPQGKDDRRPGRGCDRRQGKAIGLSLSNRIDSVLREVWNVKPLRKRCREMLYAWCDQMERAKSRACRQKDPMEVRLNEICRVLKLNDVERDLLVYAMVRRYTCFDDYPVGTTNGRHDHQIFYAMAIDRPVSAVVKALNEGERLRRYDVLDNDGDLPRGSAIVNYLDAGGKDMLEGQFYKKVALDEALPWDYYGSLKDKHGTILKEIINASRGKHGVNILLYGAPGTGKTSFTKTLAKELGLDLYEVRQGDREGQNNRPESRLAGIQVCNDQVPRNRSMVMVDEADRLLRTNFDFYGMMFGGASQSSEKGVINTVLDNVKLPMVWISNAPARAMDDSVRRRFDYSICFEKLTTAQRKSIWRNNVEKLNLARLVSDELMEKMSGKYPTSAGGITMVLENLKRMKPSKTRVEEVIDKLMVPHCELRGAKGNDDRLLPSKDYSLEGLNLKGDIGLDRIVDSVRAFQSEQEQGVKDPDRPRMNLLLWGPPGTGKTEFIKYLGQSLGTKVVVKMGSDLLSMWVGGTEQNIKDAFREAEDEKAILFLDEIDGLVQDRSGASRSWEVTQVNELLYQMENFKGVMVGATNFMDNLDQAIMRRFTFKLQFDYLDEAGKRLFFERMFKAKLTDAEAAQLAEVRNLAPGDFRTVRQSMYYLGGTVTNAQRIAELAKESSVKRDTRKAGRIGF